MISLSLCIPLLFVIYGITAALADTVGPFYNLPGPYHFDTPDSDHVETSYLVQLTNLVCVKGNNARSIKFEMKSTTPAPNGWSLVLLGVVMKSHLYTIH